MEITKEYTGFATTRFSFINKPMDKVFTILVVLAAVVANSEMYVCKTCSVFEKVVCH
jgi:hypothetical protein